MLASDSSPTGKIVGHSSVVPTSAPRRGFHNRFGSHDGQSSGRRHAFAGEQPLVVLQLAISGEDLLRCGPARIGVLAHGDVHGRYDPRPRTAGIIGTLISSGTMSASRVRGPANRVTTSSESSPATRTIFGNCARHDDRYGCRAGHSEAAVHLVELTSIRDQAVPKERGQHR